MTIEAVMMPYPPPTPEQVSPLRDLKESEERRHDLRGDLRKTLVMDEVARHTLLRLRAEALLAGGRRAENAD